MSSSPAITRPHGRHIHWDARTRSAVQKLLDGPAHHLSGLEGRGAIREFEEKVAAFAGADFAVSTSSGTAALMAALLACGVGPEDEVVVSAYGWGGTVAPVLALGAVPVFADIDPITFNLDPESARTCLTSRTRAVLATHLFGHPADVHGLSQLTRDTGVRLVFDAAQALGSRYGDAAIGAFGDVTVFSFGRGKLLTIGEGGMAVTNQPDLFERLVLVTQHPARAFRELDDPELRPYADEYTLGLRMHPLAALLGLAQMPHLANIVATRRQLGFRLAQAINRIPHLRGPVEVQPAHRDFHEIAATFSVDDPNRITRASMVDLLQEHGIPARMGPVRTPLHLRSRFHTDQKSAPPLGSRCRTPIPLVVVERRCELEEIVIEDDGQWLEPDSSHVEKLLVAFEIMEEALREHQGA